MVKFLKPNKAVIVPPRPLRRPEGSHHPVVRRRHGRPPLRPLPRCRHRQIPEECDPRGLGQENLQEVSREGIHHARQLQSHHAHSVRRRRLQSRDKKVTAAKKTKARFEERFKTGKNRWFFSKLRDFLVNY